MDGLCQGRRRDRRRQATSNHHQPTSLHQAEGSQNKSCHPARCCRAEATLPFRCAATMSLPSTQRPPPYAGPQGHQTLHRTQEYQQGQQFSLHCMSLTIQLALHVPKPPPAIPSTPLPPSARGPQVRVSPALPAVPADGDGERLHAGERVEARERQAAAEGRRRDAGLNTCLDSGEKDKQILLYDNTICRDRDTLCSQDLCLKLVSNEHEEHFLYRDSLPHSYTYCLAQALDDSPSNFTSARPPSVCTPNRIYTFEAAHHWKPGLKGEQTCTHTNQCINPLSCINMRIALSETRTRAQAQLRVARGEPEAGARARSQRCARPMEDSAQIASKTVMHTTKAMPHAARRSRYPGAAMFPVLRSVDGLCQGRRRDGILKPGHPEPYFFRGFRSTKPPSPEA